MPVTSRIANCCGLLTFVRVGRHLHAEGQPPPSTGPLPVKVPSPIDPTLLRPQPQTAPLESVTRMASSPSDSAVTTESPLSICAAACTAPSAVPLPKVPSKFAPQQ